MKHILSGVIVSLAISVSAASAQTDSPNNATTMPPAVTTNHNDSNTSAAPVAGKNSFTESQVRHRLTKHGYTNISMLKQDSQYVWHATATKDGQPVNVSVDYQGNIVNQ